MRSRVEQIVFLKGKIDRRRETPSIVVNDVIPIEEAIGKLTTIGRLKLDPARHAPAITAELDPLLKRHEGNTEVYVQVATGPSQKIVMRLDNGRFVRPSRSLVDELDQLLGSDCVQLCGAGTRRRKKTQQQPLFKEEEPAATESESAGVPPIDLPAAEMEEVAVEFE